MERAFLAEFEITEKDTQAKKFELRMKIAQPQQEGTESIAEYLKRATDLARNMSDDSLDISTATLRGMRDQYKRERESFECNKGADYTFSMQRIVKLESQVSSTILPQATMS